MMLGLKLPTDPRWVNIAEMNLEEILSDHAFCEQKAASTAISMIVSFPEYTELVQRLLYAALIEARSCERFRLLSENLKDKKLAKFYKKLMISEAHHYTMFLKFARQYGNRKEVDQKWNALLDYEAKLMRNLGTSETIHG